MKFHKTRRDWMILSLALSLPLGGSLKAIDAGGGVAFHGALSATATSTTEHNYLGHTKDTLDLNNTELIVNGSKRFDSGLSLAAQLYAYKLDDYSSLDLDYANLSYGFTQEFGVRVGRLKQPYGLYGEAQDIDVLRPFAYLPMGVYPKTFRPLGSAIDGGQLFGRIGIGKAGSLEYKLLAGYTKKVDPETPYVRSFSESGLVDVKEINIGNNIAGELVWNTPVEGWRLLASFGRLSNFTLTGEVHDAATQAVAPSDTRLLPSMLGTTAWNAVLAGKTGSSTVVFDRYTISTDYTWDKWTFGIDYFFFTIKTRTVVPAPLGTLNTEQDSDSFTGLVTYQATDKLQLGTYYSCYYGDRHYRDGSNLKSVAKNSSYLKDFDLSAAYTITDWWVVKAEVHFLKGTKSLTAALNGDAATWPSSWTSYVLKSTISF